MRRGKHGAWMRFAITILEPALLVLTRRTWEGQEHIPRRGGVILCVNHVSYADPLTFAHFVYASGRLPRFLAKSSLFTLPLVGRVVAGTGQIPVHRESDDAGAAYAAAVEAVRRGEAVCFYPEATITRDEHLWPMAGKTGAARVALATGVPVIPVAQWGAQDLLPPYTKRLRVWPRARVQLRAGPPVPLDDLRTRELTIDVLREATDRIIDAITALLADIRREPAPVLRFDPSTAQLPRTGDPRRPARSLWQPPDGPPAAGDGSSGREPA